MEGGIWVLAEQWRGRLSDVTYELLALGRELADGLGVPLQAVLLGQGVKELAGTLGAADSVLYADHAALNSPLPEPYAEALAQLATSRKPRAVLIPLTNVSAGIGSLLGEQLQAPIVNFCKEVLLKDGRMEAQCVLYGGKIEASILASGEPVVFGILSGGRPAEKGRSAAVAAVEEAAVDLPESPVRFKRFVEPEAGDVDLNAQDVLVGVGRGIQSQDNLGLAESLAQALGGAVCGSRPVVDQGWLPLARQVGKSGLTVKPKLYVAAGISGAPEHAEGMREAGLIIAINSDPGAPIFNLAHYGVVGDALDLLPALSEAIQARKG
jgi:electron transfer flavoprotein alpha subunit